MLIDTIQLLVYFVSKLRVLCAPFLEHEEHNEPQRTQRNTVMWSIELILDSLLKLSENLQKQLHLSQKLHNGVPMNVMRRNDDAIKTTAGNRKNKIRRLVRNTNSN